MDINNKLQENQEVNSLDNKITLLNGTTLICYPKAEQPDSIKEDHLKLDTSGQYFTLNKRGGASHQETENVNQKEEQDLRFFLDHAFDFFKNADRIFQDSRMFLAPVPTHCGLYYTGTSGFQHPTLGIYLEWWIKNEGDITKDTEGNDALTYFFAGSPMSGTNSCKCVYPDGTVKVFSHKSFLLIWRSFMNINTKYTEAKQRHEVYSLQEVWEILSSIEQSEASVLATKLMIQEGREKRLKEQLSALRNRYDELYQKFYKICLKHYQKDLDDFRDEYNRRKRETGNELKAIRDQRRKLKSQLKQGALDGKTYQKLLYPLNQKTKWMENQLGIFKGNIISNFLQSDDITYSMIVDYLHKDAETEKGEQ